MKYSILFLNRKKGAFSIEKVFNTISILLRNKYNISNIEAISGRDTPISVLLNIVFLRLKVRLHKKEIYHVTGVLNYLFLILPKKKSVLTIHDCIKYHQHKGLKQKIIKYIWFSLPVKYFNYITAISQKTKNELVSITGCSPNKIRVIYNPLDPNFIFSKKTFNKQKPKILHIGTFPNKNLENLIKGIQGISCHLVIVGPVDDLISQNLNSLGVSHEIHNNITDDDMKGLYSESDIVSFITTYEGFGLPIIEAQAFGRVVITSNIEPHKEIAGDAAFFVDPFNHESIKQGYLEIIDNDNLRNNLIQRGVINVKRFKLQSIADQYSSLYNEIINSI